MFSFDNRRPETRNWRNYQLKMRRRSSWRSVGGSMVKMALVILAIVGAGYGLVQGAKTFMPLEPTFINPLFNRENRTSTRDGKAVLSQSIPQTAFLNLKEPQFTTDINGQVCTVETSIDPEIQNRLLTAVEEITDKERYRSRFIGVVVMESDTGRILSMVSFDSQNPAHNTCVDNQFPAASIFKIITAAAAMETHGLTSDSPIDYTGPKHTLYRAQLQDTVKRYTNTLSLRDSFAQSVNPVFGKLGSRLLGKESLEIYSNRFGFNQSIDFEVPVAPSRISVGEDPFEQAEVASGFNMETTISPLHGAMIASVVLNSGRMKSPSIVDRVIDDGDRPVYQRSDSGSRQVISEKTSNELYRMMLTTVSKGTARKVFRGIKNNEILKTLDIGGKTGSMNNNPRFDWFIGFADNPNTRHALIVSAMVAHEDYIGKRAGEYAQIAMESFFSRSSEMVGIHRPSPRG